MDLAKRTKPAVRGLPDDALVEILTRLPAKPLCQSKCVSRSWRDLIADRLRCRKSVPLVDPSFSFLKKRLGTKDILAMASCNGLILFGYILNSSVEDSCKIMCTVCNPVTEQCVSVPRSGWSPPVPIPWRDVWNEEIEVVDGEKRVFHYLIFEPAASEHFHFIQFYQDSSTEAVEEVHSYSWKNLSSSDAIRSSTARRCLSVSTAELGPGSVSSGGANLQQHGAPAAELGDG
ncbi:hypothetical protein PR202_gb12530 [Eleusine coracana subsp. coracana]|uniref:F-box domain-containing protein n=1 Tax=Eleusine coracana subsp. coracana TaxID=191504 RepID=A0AAV5EPS0_ELECO|nr:hypothetical protein PR202_gb12530 [Eleusine coracana subsp. coracana]